MGTRRPFTGENVSNFGVKLHTCPPYAIPAKIFFEGSVTSAVAPASRGKAASVACHNQTTKGPAIMTNRTRLALFSAAVVSLGVALAPAAFAMDDMKKDSMKKDTMSKDSMKKDSMPKDSMSKDSMSKDSMKKDDGMKKN